MRFCWLGMLGPAQLLRQGPGSSLTAFQCCPEAGSLILLHARTPSIREKRRQNCAKSSTELKKKCPDSKGAAMVDMMPLL